MTPVWVRPIREVRHQHPTRIVGTGGHALTTTVGHVVTAEARRAQSFVESLPPSADSPARGRRTIAQRCRAWGLSDSVRDVAVLLASELLTNAVLHGRSDVRLEVELRADTLRVSVGDDNSRQPVVLDSDDDALDGRGMAMVESLARRWGIDPAPLGKRVWFELGLA